MKLVRWLITLTVCTAVVAGLYHYKTGQWLVAEQAAAATPEYGETVEAVAAEAVIYRDRIDVLGETVAPQWLELRNALAGTIETVNFRAGEQVMAGQLLVQLDIREETADLKAAKSGLQAAKQAWQRLSKLRRSDVASQQRLEEARSEMASRQARVEVLQSRIDKKTLRAPFDGIAGIHDLQPGQYLEINSVLTTLTGTPGYSWVDFRVPQVYPQLEPDAVVEVTQLDGSAATAKLSATSPAIDSASRSRLYRAKLFHSTEHPAPGHRASVRVKVPTSSPGSLIRLPATALLNSSRGRFVYKLEADDEGILRAVPQPVEVTLQRGDEVLISSGLNVGEQVASAGAFKLFPGVQVYVSQRHQTAEVQ